MTTDMARLTVEGLAGPIGKVPAAAMTQPNGTTGAVTVGDTHSLDALILSYVGERIRRGEIQRDTARNIRNHLFLFAQSFGRRPVDQLGLRALERWVEEMEKAGTAKSTQALRMSSLRVFAKWCVRNGHVTKDWTMDAPQIRRARQIPRDMDNHHFELVLKAARDERERLIVWLMFGCGLRCVEVSRLNVDDYEKATGNLFVTGKGMHERYVPVPLPVRAAIASYLATESHHSGALIRTHTDDKRRVGAGRLSGIVRRLVSDAGVKVRNYDGRSAHGLRSAGASDLMDECDDIRVVSEFLGHVNIATTDRYLTRRGLEKIREAQNRRFEDDLDDERSAA